MNILVLGGAGLIGSHLCRALINQGHTVVCHDDGVLDNVVDLLSHPRFETLAVGKVCEFPDQIYNLASPTAPGHFKANPIGTLMTNVEVTEECLKMSVRFKIPLLHASSVRVLEECDTYSDNACYIQGKRAAETLCYEYKKKGADVKCVRMFNVYGPGMKKDDSRVIPSFIRLALENEDIMLWYGGNQTDSFTYVKDIVPALIKTMNTNAHTSFPFSIGNPNFISIQKLAELIKKECNSTSRLVPFWPEAGNYRTIEKVDVPIESNLSYGIGETIQYYKELMDE